MEDNSASSSGGKDEGEDLFGLGTEPAEILDDLGITNADCEWLTYETLFNQTGYRKSNHEIALGLVRIEFDEVSIFILPSLCMKQSMPFTKQLIGCFLPGIPVEYLIAVADGLCPWH